MLPHFATRFTSRFYRFLDIICVLIVCSYVFFDVLDIDGSNFLRLLTPTQRVFLIAEAVPVADLRDLREPAVLSGNIAHLHADPFANQKWSLKHVKFSLSPLISIRIRGYRVGLPRDSVADASPYH
jgi:hypothetical protein